MTRTLVFGGARSGKSQHAERLAAESGKELIYIATARAGDEEMAARIAHHRDRRSARWTTVEAPLLLAEALETQASPQRVVLVDCLTLWLSNLLFAEDKPLPDVGPLAIPSVFAEQRARLLAALADPAGDVILVSNEVGMGIVPQGAVSRWFVDEAGRLNQDVARVCDCVHFVAAGLPLRLKG